jgi:hypothetical protein
VLCSNKRGWSAYSRRRYAVAGRSPYLAITVMVQRLSVPDPLSHKFQCRFLAPILGIAGTSRLDRIGRFNRLHAVTKVAIRETFPRRNYGISETLSKDSQWSKHSQLHRQSGRKRVSCFYQTA